MKTELWLPSASVATQTDPWSDDCCLSQFGDEHDVMGDDVSSEHIYQLYDKCYPAADVVPVYDYLLRGDSDTDDGYDVIDDNDVSIDVFENFTAKKQPTYPVLGIGQCLTTFTANMTHSSSISGGSVAPFSMSPTGRRSSTISENDDVQDIWKVKCPQPVIRLGVESCRDKRTPPFEHFVDNAPVVNANSSRQMFHGRLVPKMGTRLGTIRRQTGNVTGPLTVRLGIGSPRDRIDSSSHDASMATSSTSDSERSSPTVDASMSRAEVWSFNEDTSVPHSHPTNLSSYHHHLSSVTQLKSETAERSALTAVEEHGHCVATSADVVKMSPVESRQTVEDVEAKQTSSKTEDVASPTRRRFIYEHYADVMYTNEANLAHTIMVQQRLFQQLLADVTPLDCQNDDDNNNNNNNNNRGDDRDDRLPTSQITRNDLVHSLRRSRSKPAADDQMRDVDKDGREVNGAKWVVRRRKDGTRYVTRCRQDNSSDTRRRQPSGASGEHIKMKSDKPQHVNKHRRVSTSGRDHSSFGATLRHDEKLKADHQTDRHLRTCGAEPASRGAMKSGQNHNILAVVTI